MLKWAKLIAAAESASSKLYRLSQFRYRLIFPCMNLKDGTSIVADLTTIGRKTGLPRTVELRFVFFQGCFYASSSRVEGKHWCQNMLKNPAVEVAVRGETLACTARQVTDEGLRREVL